MFITKIHICILKRYFIVAGFSFLIPLLLPPHPDVLCIYIGLTFPNQHLSVHDTYSELFNLISTVGLLLWKEKPIRVDVNKKKNFFRPDTSFSLGYQRIILKSM